jgi:endonuclease/exonuclease/phosphatase family metal-dependent hydrolase
MVPRRQTEFLTGRTLVSMSAAKDALIDIRPDVLCLQEVRDLDNVAELVSILPNFQTLVASRFLEMGSSGPLSIQQIAIASNRTAEAAWSETFKPSPATPPRGFSFAAIRHGKTVLLVYSVHFKSNRGEATTNIAKPLSCACWHRCCRLSWNGEELCRARTRGTARPDDASTRRERKIGGKGSG